MCIRWKTPLCFTYSQKRMIAIRIPYRKFLRCGAVLECGSHNRPFFIINDITQTCGNVHPCAGTHGGPHPGTHPVRRAVRFVIRELKRDPVRESTWKPTRQPMQFAMWEPDVGQAVGDARGLESESPFGNTCRSPRENLCGNPNLCRNPIREPKREPMRESHAVIPCGNPMRESMPELIRKCRAGT